MRLAARAVCASVRSMRQASAAVCSCFALCWSCKPGQLTPHQPLQPLILLNPREARWLPFRIMLPKIEGLPLRSDKVYNYPFFFLSFFFFLRLLSQGDRVLWLWVCSFALCICLCFVLSTACVRISVDFSFQVRCKDLSEPQKKNQVSKVTDTYFLHIFAMNISFYLFIF